jgi:acyl dehydratase
MTGAADLAEGARVTLAEQTVTRLDLAAYCLASGDRNPIHWSDEAARQAGLPDVIAHGMLTMGFVSRAVIEWAGDGARLAEMSVRFARPLVVPNTVTGATLQVNATIHARTDSRVELDLDVTTADGTTLLTASRAVLILPSGRAA